MVDQLQPEAVPGPVRRRQGTHPPVDCELQMRSGLARNGRRVTGVLAVALTAVSVLAGCTSTVEGTATKSGSGDTPRNNESERQYPNLQKECDVLTEDILAETVNADP